MDSKAEALPFRKQDPPATSYQLPTTET